MNSGFIDTPPQSALILVAVINHPRDLEIARLLGWHGIPLRSAPKVIAVDYIAFYQTGAFGEDKWRIQYTAPVRGYELTTRVELLRDELDHPSANLEYYKVQIGSLVALPNPILAKSWRRITFFYTTGEYLQSAETVKVWLLVGMSGIPFGSRCASVPARLSYMGNQPYRIQI